MNLGRVTRQRKCGPRLLSTARLPTSLASSTQERSSTLSDCSFFGRLITPARHQRNYEEARKAFAKAAKFQLDLDWPEMLWEAWLTFEHSHGTVEEIQDALDVIERARVQVETRRAKVLNLSSLFSNALLKVVSTGGRASRLSSYASRG